MYFNTIIIEETTTTDGQSRNIGFSNNFRHWPKESLSPSEKKKKIVGSVFSC